MKPITVVEVKFEKPFYADRKKFAFEYTAATQETLAHGHPCFGGKIIKTEEGLYRATGNGDVIVGEPCKTRKEAVQNIASSVAEAFKNIVAKRNETDAVRTRRQEKVIGINQQVQASNVEVGSENSYTINEPLRFTVHVNGLNEQAVEKVLAALKAFEPGLIP